MEEVVQREVDIGIHMQTNWEALGEVTLAVCKELRSILVEKGLLLGICKICVRWISYCMVSVANTFASKKENCLAANIPLQISSFGHI